MFLTMSSAEKRDLCVRKTSLKDLRHKNTAERVAAEKEQASIEGQRRIYRRQLTHEENELKQQLKQLQIEKLILTELDPTADGEQELSSCARCMYVGGLCFFVPSTARSFRDGTPQFTKDMKLGISTVPTGNRTPGRRVAVHYTTAAPRQLRPVFVYV